MTGHARNNDAARMEERAETLANRFVALHFAARNLCVGHIARHVAKFDEGIHRNRPRTSKDDRVQVNACDIPPLDRETAGKMRLHSMLRASCEWWDATAESPSAREEWFAVKGAWSAPSKSGEQGMDVLGVPMTIRNKQLQREQDGQVVMRGGIWTGSCVGTFSGVLVKADAPIGTI